MRLLAAILLQALDRMKRGALLVRIKDGKAAVVGIPR